MDDGRGIMILSFWRFVEDGYDACIILNIWLKMNILRSFWSFVKDGYGMIITISFWRFLQDDYDIIVVPKVCFSKIRFVTIFFCREVKKLLLYLTTYFYLFSQFRDFRLVISILRMKKLYTYIWSKFNGKYICIYVEHMVNS